jgi:hypothetical protein
MVIVCDLNQFTGKSCGAIARQMLSAGHDPSKLIHFKRGSTPIWTKDSPISYWAGLDVKESQDGRWMRFVKYAPQD